MPIRKLLLTSGVTLLLAVCILLAGSLLLTGAWALLPDRTGDVHTFPSVSAGGSADSSAPGEASALYPWDQLTVPLGDGSLDLDEEELYAMLYPFLASRLSPFWVLDAWYGGEAFTNASNTMAGIRDIDIWVHADGGLITDDDLYGKEEPIEEPYESDSVHFRFSFAVRDGYDSRVFCFVSLAPMPREEYLLPHEEAGTAALVLLLKERDLNLAGGSPFANFLWRYVDLCAQFECDYTAYSTAHLLFETGDVEIKLIEHVVYCTFTGEEGVMTLLCDPIDQTVYGISLRLD